MTPRQRQRLRFVLLLLGAFIGATVLVLYALDENLLYFYSPSQITAGEAPANRAFNVGGMVVGGSVAHDGDATVRFVLTDHQHTVTVRYTGILPDLFREGQGIVATGRLRGQLFIADRVLAKHDENYMPPEVADMLDGETAAARGAKPETAGTEPIGIPMGGGYTPKAERP